MAVLDHDEEAIDWFCAALETFDIAIAAEGGSIKPQEMSEVEEYTLWRALHSKHIATWAVHGTKDIELLRRAIGCRTRDRSFENSDTDTYHELKEVFISELVEAEEWQQAFEFCSQLYGKPPPPYCREMLDTFGGLVCSLKLLDDDKTDDALCDTIKSAYLKFLDRSIKYDKNGPSWPFNTFDLVRFQYLRHRYIERDNPLALQVFKEIRGY